MTDSWSHETKGRISRRGFINLVGRGAGAAGLYRTLNAMGVLTMPQANAQQPQLPASSGRGRRVVIVGAGIAGMTTAYELGKAGYQCQILEARERPGGRVWTIRGGDPITEIDSSQRVRWPRHRDLYFNAGAARLSHHHHGILSYCREFGIPLEVFVNDNRAAFAQADGVAGGQPQPLRRLIADARGAIAALAAKSVAPDDAHLLGYLAWFGALQEDMTYRGSDRAGFATPPEPDKAGVPLPPLPLDEIMRAGENVGVGTTFSELWDQSPTMLQPVGGMDAIPQAFARAVRPALTYHAEVVRLRRVGARARVTWRDRKTGRQHEVDADFVVCTAPLTVLKDIDSDFIESLKMAIETGAALYIPAVKVAFYSGRRWWETEHRLYGGISWTSQDITQMWYPTHGLGGRAGIVVGAYIWTSEIGRRFAAMTPGERHVAAMADGERLHAGYSSMVDRGASVAWSKIPYSLGGWIEWDDPGRREAYPVLLQGDGPFYFAGEHMSYNNGWQEGAVQSAHYTVGQIAERVRTGRPAQRLAMPPVLAGPVPRRLPR
jgi:monoamine oxidase